LAVLLAIPIPSKLRIQHPIANADGHTFLFSTYREEIGVEEVADQDFQAHHLEDLWISCL
jgi:hypothetical protein